MSIDTYSITLADHRHQAAVAAFAAAECRGEDYEACAAAADAAREAAAEEWRAAREEADAAAASDIWWASLTQDEYLALTCDGGGD